ncbi:hypothetical protein M8C13_32335 [Crossiella sp. SN42]|uniref:hypothetical protein n=1 Tax=Crossiella sp. SN42 TaxID=2944808 RepID=UPI00207D20FA|nr:hypothetical protein [Crossiella sp. SN42]MCO1580453.1 hypothetical protein [Crossiella sp. SN42]
MLDTGSKKAGVCLEQRLLPLAITNSDFGNQALPVALPACPSCSRNKEGLAAMTAPSLSENPRQDDRDGLIELLRVADTWARARDFVVPLGLHASRQAGRLEIVITALDPNMPGPTSIAVTSPSSAALSVLAGARRIRWVATDLVATATVLAEEGLRLRNAMCLSLTERALDAYHGVIPEAAPATGVPLSHRYSSVCGRFESADDGPGVESLVRLDSVNALLAAEMNAAGIGWDSAGHERLLGELLHKPRRRDPYPRLTKLDRDIAKALGASRTEWWRQLHQGRLHDDAEAIATRVIQRLSVDNPATKLIIRWLELMSVARHGYDWAEQWVSDGRWWPVFRPFGTVSGRWVAEGGAIGLPTELRPCVIAGPGRVLVRARLAQLEPRMLAHLSGDTQLVPLCGKDDLYRQAAGLHGADEGVVRDHLQAALRDDQSSTGRRSTAILTSWFPEAMRYLGSMTLRGRTGELVRSGLGRTCTPPDPCIAAALHKPWSRRSMDERKVQVLRGAQVRAFEIQATAAELACVLAAEIRAELTAPDTRVVLFDRDEFVIETPADHVTAVEYSLPRLAERAATAVLGTSRVRWPLVMGHGANWAEASRK